MICKHCGSQIADGAQFCTHCGQKAEQPAAAAGVPENAAAPANAAVRNAVVPPPTAYVGYDANKKEASFGGAEKKRSKLPLILGVVAAAVGLFVFLSGSLGGIPANTQPEAPEPVESEPEVPASQAAVEELAGLVAQAEALVTDAHARMDALEADEELGEVARMRQSAEILEGMLGEVEALRQQADAVTGMGSTMKTAAEEYFNMVSDSQNSCIEVLRFFADYTELGTDLIWARPAVEDYAEDEYYNVLYAWYKEAKAGYDALDSCPACLKTEWKTYGETLSLNHNISYKLSQAQKLGDYLRYRSALNMSVRYETAEQLQHEQMDESLNCEIAHYERQQRYATALAAEIAAYVQLSEEEREGYAFKNVQTGRLVFEYDAVNTIYPSLYSSYDAFLVIRTGCVSGTRRVLIEAEIPGFTQIFRETVDLDAAYTVIRIKPPALTGQLDLDAAKDAQIQLTISEPNGSLIEARTFPVKLKSKYDFDWYSDEYGLSTRDNILCFMTPEARSITDLKRLAIDEITGMTNGNMQSFVGYQGNRWNNHYVGTYLQAAGIMRALYESGVRYNMDPFSISGSNQHILFPEDVLFQRSGLCIETSLVVASALQSAGMHVFLIFPPGHAQVAVEVWNGSGSDTTGTGRYFLIETTALSSSNNRENYVTGANALLNNTSPSTGAIYYYNQDRWKEYLTSDTYIIDCADSSVLGMTPFAN